ncbi:Nucleoid-associated protein YgaU, contains BON and LysM domains [Nitratireductor aquibiodomus]|uniref:Nucleoid-associated protein YgaU, contains BON and LysM domains n=1 Tax=Nitratireductor aquibiodomus TaxID=204799 RepID=A0A1H4NGS9_9HYPH|nr:Ig-like domain-containing protein [Nitratireductor aquibiodomus]SEB94411.1 Nucleoid-associated protein YgaU, contains BON and LysM domains [Nitratireductor aquibiodomus]
MGLTPLKGLLFFSGAVVAGLGAAYVLGAFDAQEPRPAALSSSPSPDAGAPAAAAKQDAGAASREARLEDASQAEDNSASETLKQAQEIAPPTFDIVRVEPNGSMVIAGKAEPNARIEIINGATVLGTATSGASGDFAAVLEDPLEPGDYQIVLRATTPDNLAATSLETAIVTVPDDEAGQVLALVDQPGAPSRLITVPEAKAPQEGESETQAEVAPEPSAPAPAGQEPLATAEKPQGEPAPVANEAEGEQPAEAAQTEEQSPPATTAAEAAGSPFIEAVEIDGRQVFVAGAARPGSTIRVYVNQILLGETVTTPNGRFLIEATRELPIGDYIVRADMLSDDGRTVVARAAVPFTRAEGEQVAAVAAPDSGSDVRNDAVDGKDARLPPAGASPSVQEPDAAAEAASPGAETTAPKLAPVDGSVIIRRGDTLWHISRRVYGRGIRYTTLYLANQDQIEDPDRIWPGQVFAVPESTEEGEAADMEAIEDQMVKPENAN